MGQQRGQGRNQRIPETNENEDTTTPTPWDTGKAILRGRSIELQAFLKKTIKSSNKQSNFTLKRTSHIKELEKDQQTKPTVSRRKKIIKIRAEINEIESKINNTKDQ